MASSTISPVTPLDHSTVESGSVSGSVPVNGGSNGNNNSLTNAELLASVSQLVERVKFAATYGFSSFNGDRDLFVALGYLDKITYKDYLGRYRRGGLAKRIVNFFPEETWNGGVEIYDEEEVDIETPWEAEVKELLERLNFVSKIETADRLAGIGEYSTLLIGVGVPGDDLSKELPKNLKSKSIIFLTPLSQDEAKIKTYVKDTTDPRWGLVETYTVNVTRGGEAVLAKDVHWSRMIHLIHESLNSETHGFPDLEDVWNDLDNLYKLVGGGAEVSYRNAKQIKHANLNVPKDIQGARVTISDSDITALKSQIDELNHDLRDFLVTKGVDLNVLATQVDKFNANVDSVLDLLAGTKAIPRRILLGSERGELSSTQDRQNKQDRITARRDKLGAGYVRQFIDRLIDYKIISTPKDGKYFLAFAEEDELSEEEKISVAAKAAAANKSQHDADGTILLTNDEIRDMYLGLEPIEVDEEEEEEVIEGGLEEGVPEGTPEDMPEVPPEVPNPGEPENEN